MPKRSRESSNKLSFSPLKPMTFVLPTTTSPTILKNPQAEAALLLAASCGDITQVKDLLKLGVNINVQDKISGKTPLMRAVVNNQINVVKTLITKGADHNIQDNFSNTALFLAASKGRIEIVQEIVGTTCNKPFLDQPHKLYGSPLKVALENGHQEVAKTLINAGATVTEGMGLIIANSFGVVMQAELFEILTSAIINDESILSTSDDRDLSGYLADTESD